MLRVLREMGITNLFLPPDERGPVSLESLAPYTHLRLLTQLETRFKISLAESKAIPEDEIKHIHRLAWIVNESMESMLRRTNTFPVLYLTEEDHRQISLTIIKQKEQSAARGRPMTVSPAREYWESCDVPAGQHIFFGLGSEPSIASIITRFDINRNNPNAVYPLKAAVANTILMGELSMSMLSTHNKLPHDQVETAGNIAVAYYTNILLRNAGFSREARIVKTMGNVAEGVDIWKKYINRVGEKNARYLFLYGKLDNDDNNTLEAWKILTECVNAVLKRD
jgi:hypothetical protein